MVFLPQFEFGAKWQLVKLANHIQWEKINNAHMYLKKNLCQKSLDYVLNYANNFETYKNDESTKYDSFDVNRHC